MLQLKLGYNLGRYIPCFLLFFFFMTTTFMKHIQTTNIIFYCIYDGICVCVCVLVRGWKMNRFAVLYCDWCCVKSKCVCYYDWCHNQQEWEDDAGKKKKKKMREKFVVFKSFVVARILRIVIEFQVYHIVHSWYCILQHE